MIRKIKAGVSLLTFLLVLVYALSFASANSNLVALDFLVGQSVELPVALWLGLAVLLGALLGALVGAWSTFKKRRQIRRLNRELEQTRQRLGKIS